MRFSAIGIFAFMFAMIFFTAPVKAQEMIGRGYSVVDYRSLIKTYFGLYNGGNPTSGMINDYAKLVYCDLYRKHFKDDFKWASIQADIKEEFHSQYNNMNYNYEIVGDIPIERYNFERKSFPIRKGYQLQNIGKLDVFSSGGGFSYCDESGAPEHLPALFTLSVPNPINIMEVPVSEERAKQVIKYNYMDEETGRIVFIRFRVEFLGYKTEKASSQNRMTRTEFQGNITAIDFFLDPELTQKLYSVALDQMY
jgi:hypothetical protein